MNSMDILVPPAVPDSRDQRTEAMWNATHERMERFLPGFLDEIIPSPPPPAAPAAISPAVPEVEPKVAEPVEQS